MEYRKATREDINLLMELRKFQLVDEGITADKDIDNELEDFFQRKLAEGSLIQWLVMEENEIIATGAIVIYEFPPTYTNKSGKKAYVTNMYTKNAYRGKGIATTLLTKLVEEAKSLGIKKIWLGASKLGRPVYKKFGFKETDEWMELELE
ncbi:MULTISPECIES: GNAT family N-acetyltransferase [Niallia]|jgi:GNAT superfamily N-acetyltransferase|uniref:GCN5 family acetyltransferase n=1 Tax=Niallia circulans TaxID=1397 RepID=A0A0J1INU1_NIACI|nr:GNAT family N-acetyltransferase [Niallia circulans]KLV27631.1 GCN5 family acetyltransferase [Niallia circulans]MCM2981171.1 GNAT family N-acetyltransferase [Niallia circulans]MED5101720.1 GNAT family N-acetyltransferase [Niallia circulans]NRG31263.1 GNAT family N-acetyltransferase [Niallia circulans]PAD25822.1 N-acetyltransferase [Niallia circulans]